MFRNTGANEFAKNQMRLAYEDKRDLYCISVFGYHIYNIPIGFSDLENVGVDTKFVFLG